MTRMCLITLVMTLSANSLAVADGPWRFRWAKGQVLNYKIEHNTTVDEVVKGQKVNMSSKLLLKKRWEVTDVDANGVATLQFSLTSMRHEQTRPNGDKLFFDSEDPAQSTPGLREQMQKFIGKTLGVLRVDGQGRVIDVKKGSRAKFLSELPFVVVLSSKEPEVGYKWKRNYQVTLEPPAGTGEQFPASQTYECTSTQDGNGTIVLTTEIAKMPSNVLDRIPLMQRQPHGEVVFDVEAGRLNSARLLIDKQINNHRGENSTYHFVSNFKQTYVGGN